MDPKDLIGRTLDTGRGVTQRSQERIESLVGQLQRLSEDQLDQVTTLVGEMRDRSLLTGEQVASFVDRRVRAQLAALGIASQADLDRLEAKVDRLSGPPGPAPSKGAAPKGKASGADKKKSKSATSAKGPSARTSTKAGAPKPKPKAKAKAGSSATSGGKGASSTTSGS